MPDDDHLGLKEEQALLPVCPQPSESQPEQTIRPSESGFGRLPPERGELVPKCDIFEQEQALGLAARNQGPEQNQEDLRLDKPSFEEASHEINDFEGLPGFRLYRQA